jgi:hypothetical protein
MPAISPREMTRGVPVYGVTMRRFEQRLAETDKPHVRTVVHLHGTKVMPDGDHSSRTGRTTSKRSARHDALYDVVG